MKKIIRLLSIGTGMLFSTLQAQSEVNFGDFPKPVPSVSSLATYTNTPTSNATGIPDISFSLLSLPSYNNGANLSTGISYNPMNVSESEPVSEVGRGWTLFAGGVISRSIENDVDEMFDDSNAGNYYKNSFDDTYYYNLPGISGKFKFVRDVTNNTFRLVNLTSNKIKIDYTRESNMATLIVKSFTITDAKGVKYVFEDYSRSNQERNPYIIGGKVYKSAFFLTSITDANNVQLASFSYQKDTKLKNNANFLLYETCKVKTITSPGFGKIEFEYLYNSALENTMSDPYQIQKVVLKDNYNHMISGYALEYLGSNGRILSKLKKLTRNNVVSETTEFEYGDAAYNGPPMASGYDPNMICPQLAPDFPIVGQYGILKRIINPSGGVVEYNFEQNLSYIDRTKQSYLDEILAGNAYSDPQVQYIGSFWSTNYDTHVSTNYSFTVTGNTPKRVFLQFGVGEYYTDNPFWDTNTPWSVGYVLKSGGEILTPQNSCQSPMFNQDFYTVEYNLAPGTYTIQISGSGGNGGVGLYEIAHLPLPFSNTARARGVRIASIKNYNDRNDTTPVKTTKFEYNSFTDNTTSSGYSVAPDTEDLNASNYIIYKNVKVTNADDNNGYVKYYYKIPDDFPKEDIIVNGISSKFWTAYNFISSGLLDKKEVYDAQNKLLVSEKTDYTFDSVPDVENYSVNTAFTKLGWMKKLINTSTSYFENNQSTEEQSETNFNVFNFGIASTKKILDGNTIEQFYTYPESGYTQLSNAHIMDVPVIVEEKNDGKTTSKAETKYDNAASALPTSVLAFNVNDNTSKTAKKIDLYDAKGNVLQYTSETGIPTTVVYGYDQTLPIARIEGVTYAQISSLVQTIIDASNADAQNPTNETALITALENFRKNSTLLNAQITTYTYDPLVGATTVTPPVGIREIYQYDDQNRLQKIVDMNGITLKEYKYNYKH